ncbi:MAG: SoxR reducing system RseC family protein, partial [Spirochaeta sp.]|nr:SoxR reducing system RseC family protein [Spirochaeta sp.]
MMSGIAIVRRVDRSEQRADVVVYPESCGRCEDDGGHCVREHRTVPARVPDGFSIQPGDHVRLISNPVAVFRGLGRVVGIPFVAGVAGLYIGGVRFAEIAPQAIAQLSGRSGAALDIPVAALVLAFAGVAAALAVALRRGVRREDWPTVA